MLDWSAYLHTIDQYGNDLKVFQLFLLGCREQYAILNESRKEKPHEEELQEL